MTDKKTFSNLAIKLRRQAEEKADKVTENLEVLSPAEIRQILHELRVHQIELEIQNEELRDKVGPHFSETGHGIGNALNDTQGCRR